MVASDTRPSTGPSPSRCPYPLNDFTIHLAIPPRDLSHPASFAHFSSPQKDAFQTGIKSGHFCLQNVFRVQGLCRKFLAFSAQSVSVSIYPPHYHQLFFQNKTLILFLSCVVTSDGHPLSPQQCRTSREVQWVRLHALRIRGPGFIPGQGTRSHRP